MPGAVRTAAVRVGLGLAGALTTIVALLAHRHSLSVGPVLIPWALVLTVVATYAATRAAGVLGGAGGAIAYGVGWTLMLLLTYRPRAEGDYLVAGDVRGYGLLAGGLGAVGLAIVQAVSQSSRQSPNLAE